MPIDKLLNFILSLRCILVALEVYTLTFIKISCEEGGYRKYVFNFSQNKQLSDFWMKQWSPQTSERYNKSGTINGKWVILVNNDVILTDRTDEHGEQYQIDSRSSKSTQKKQWNDINEDIRVGFLQELIWHDLRGCKYCVKDILATDLFPLVVRKWRLEWFTAS